MPNNQFGDFQTPIQLARQCLDLLSPGDNDRIFEPTCGCGSFLHAAADLFPGIERRGVELNPDYAVEASRYAQVDVANIYTYDFGNIDWKSKGRLFVVGNPPWVTAAELRRMGSSNLPSKSNFKNMRGLDALLGGSNFDICEFIIIQMISAFLDENMTLGMLCKTQVARNVLEYAARRKLPMSNAKIYRIDAKKWFNASADACWFIFDSDPLVEPNYSCCDYRNLNSVEPDKIFGFCSGKMVSNIDAYNQLAKLDGASPETWRSGVKHDAAKVFELKEADGLAVSSFGTAFGLENSAIYPLMKSSDVANGKKAGDRWIIVPQKQLGENTDHLEVDNPEIWRYLNDHAEIMGGRRSSIYRGKPKFSVFGIGEYTFAPYKVAVSGLYKEPRFALIPPCRGKPVMLDDTCYMLSFNDAESAFVTWALLSGDECMMLIKALYFSDSKRPVTKKLLQRLDYSKVDEPVDKVVDRASAEAARLCVQFNAEKAKRFCKDLTGSDRRGLA